MDLIKFFVELRYSQSHKLFRVYDELYSSLVGKEPSEKVPTVLPGFGLHVRERKMRVLVDPERSVVDLEYVPNPGYCLDTIVQSFRKINELAPLPSLARLGARSYWIKPSSIDFEQLVSRYKEKLFRGSRFVEESVDIGVSFVFNDEDYKVNVTFGPMEMTQLRGMLFSKPDDLPSVLTFLDVDYSLKSEGLELSERELRDFTRRALDFAKRESEEVEALLVGGQ